MSKGYRQMKQLWISDNFLDQQLFCEVYSGYDDNIINRAYEIWNHAKNLIEQNDDTYSMSDAIWNLRRCLDQRTRTIEENYNLKQIPFLQKPKGYYELLEYYGVARPFIVKNLFSIRNDIDHHDATPPPKERCMELLDIVWYFLKATDRILQEKKKDLFFSKEADDPYFVYFSMDYRHKDQIPFWGWFPKDGLWEQSALSAIPIQVQSVNTKNSLKGDYHKNRDDTDLCVHGYFQIDAVYYPKLIKRCLCEY